MFNQFLTHAICGVYGTESSSLVNSVSIGEMTSSLRTCLDIKKSNESYSFCATTDDIFSLNGHYIAAVIGSPNWTSQGLSAIATKQGAASALGHAYSTMGTDFLANISGEFLVVVIDLKRKKCIIAVDHMGRHPLYYSINKNGVIFASSASAVYAHPELSHKFSYQGLFNYLYFHMIPSPSSIYQTIHKLPVGSYIEWKQDDIQINNYWSPSFKKEPKKSFEDSSKELRGLLKRTVQSHYGDGRNVGAFLSGGLDSSTVAGMLSEISDQQTEAFSIGFSADGYDEMAYARITAKHFGLNLHEYYVTPEDVVEALPNVAASYDEPFGNSSALPAYFCAKFAKEHGIKKLLAGDGGDELFAGNERYTKQMVFEAYSKVPLWLRNRIAEPIVSASSDKIAIFRKAKSYINQANTPLPDRLQTYNFLHQHKPEEIFTDKFLSNVEPSLPLKYQREIYNRPINASILDRMLYLDWQYTLADNDLRKVSHMCAMAGIEVSYPMLDDELVNFSCEIPDKWKIKEHKLRHFYKESLRGWLPDQTIYKKKQGFGLPFGVWMRDHKPLQEMAYDNLNKLKTREYFNKPFIDQVVKLHREGHASYYGELVWILTVLELWLQTHRP